MTETTPTPAAIAWTPRQHLRAVIFGIGMGAATILASAPIWFHISSALLELSLKPGPLASVLGALVLESPELIFAPLLAFAAAFVVQAPRWSLVVPQVIAAQVMHSSVVMISPGTSLLLVPGYLATVAVGVGGGISLSLWAFSRSERFQKERELRRRAEASQTGKLAQIDFEAVKRTEPEAPKSEPSGGAPQG